MHAEALTEIKDPGPLRVSGSLKVGMLVLSAVGAGGFFLAYNSSPKAAFASLLISFCFFFFLGVAGLFFTSLHYASSAKWSTPMRRIAEGMTSFIFPYGLVLLVLLALGTRELYNWSVPGAEYPYKGSLKDYYLSDVFFWGRCLAFVLVCVLFRHLIVGRSIKQDASKDPAVHGQNVPRSIVFLILFAILFTFFTMDLLMTLEARFFSTMFGLYCFSGLHLSGLATIILITLALRRAGYIDQFVRSIHVRDLGTWLMAFATFMMYIGFSQYMLIWYANLPDETFYFMERIDNGWWYLLVALPLLKWVTPFLVLMPYSMRTNPYALILCCSTILVGQYLDLWWMVMPSFHDALLLPGLADVLVFLGVGGVFGFSLLSFYQKHSLLPVGDPDLLPAVNGEHLH